MATTSKLADWLGRALQNNNPGVSVARDYLGRATVASDKDSDGRALTNTPTFPPADWAANTAVSLGTIRRIPGTKEVQTLTSTGTPVGNLQLRVENNGVTRTTTNISTVNQANLQSALNALDNVDDGDITVTGSASPFTFTVQEELGNIPQIAAVNTGVTGGTWDVATTTQGASLGAILQVTTAGTTHASNKPTAPQVGKTVTDGTAVWTRLK